MSSRFQRILVLLLGVPKLILNSISVVIPALNEAARIAQTLEALKSHSPSEIILVDGLSMDGTPKIAERLGGSRILRTKPGRAFQMNEGARQARGDLLLFLHADTVLPPRGLREIQEVMAEKEIVGGRFRVQFDEPVWSCRLTAYCTRFAFFSYGDQGFFTRRSVFEELGGFNTGVPFEDIDFFRRLRRKGKTVILRSAVTTSARRFRSAGFLKQKAVNFILSGLVLMGFSPRKLIRLWYPDIR